MLASAMVDWAWYMDGFGALLILLAALSKAKFSQALYGLLLLMIAIGNVAIVSAAGVDISKEIASVIGVIVFGGLGVAFIAGWVMRKAT